MRNRKKYNERKRKNHFLMMRTLGITLLTFIHSVCVCVFVRTHSLSCVWLLYVPFSHVNCNHHVVFPFLSAYLSYKWKLVLFGHPTLIPTILDICHFQREFVHIIFFFKLCQCSFVQKLFGKMQPGVKIHCRTSGMKMHWLYMRKEKVCCFYLTYVLY